MRFHLSVRHERGVGDNDRGTSPRPECLCNLASFLGCADCVATFWSRGAHPGSPRSGYLAALVAMLGENLR